MPLSHTITEETTTTRHGYQDTSATTNRVVRHTFTGTACVTLTRSNIEVSEPYGEANRQTVAYYGDSGVVADAVTDLIAALQREVLRAADHGTLHTNVSATACLQTLQRFAGEMGLEYVAPTVNAEAV